jgi:hypothetical protein
MPRMKKGSSEAQLWGERMRLLRSQKKVIKGAGPVLSTLQSLSPEQQAALYATTLVVPPLAMGAHAIWRQGQDAQRRQQERLQEIQRQELEERAGEFIANAENIPSLPPSKISGLRHINRIRRAQ